MLDKAFAERIIHDYKVPTPLRAGGGGLTTTDSHIFTCLPLCSHGLELYLLMSIGKQKLKNFKIIN